MTIAERIIEVVETEEKGNMSRFARNIHVTPAYISKLKNFPDSIPSDRTILDMCACYGVNETWLRTGAGEMKSPKTREQKIAAITAAIYKDDDDFRASLIDAIVNLTPEQILVLKEIADQMHKARQKEKEE